ncbi:MAG TPA: YebC/PmpR family DNA-binding transcriptional regulator [Patescibacteria group bacterium]|nr:YebC/PmpR family DNA-binding transcriptional regulator [Patescibacteria group bacterium]
MSGHSKWHNIQGRKGKQDAKRSNLFTKFAKGITVAAQSGGGDSEMNFSLRIAIEKAKAVGMPKDNIERAIKRGTGELNDGNKVETVIYEGYGPGGIAILLKALTDNKNRTVSDVKHLLTEHGGSMAGPGSVLWMFEQWGLVILNKSGLTKNLDELELELIEAGAEDISEVEDGKIEIKTKMENLQKAVNALKVVGIEPIESGLVWFAKDEVEVSPENSEKLASLFSDFEDNDDIEDFYTNAK